MPRARAEIPTDWPPERALRFVADFDNLPRWDPSARRVRRLAGEGTAPDSSFEVLVRVVGRDSLYTYVITAASSTEVTLEADAPGLHLVDRVTVRPMTGGSTLIYCAEISPRGPLWLATPLLAVVFRRLAARAEAGLRRELSRA